MISLSTENRRILYLKCIMERNFFNDNVGCNMLWNNFFAFVDVCFLLKRKS